MDNIKREWCNSEQGELWIKLAKEEALKVMDAARKLKGAISKIDYDEVIKKMSEGKVLLNKYVWCNISEMEKYAYLLARTQPSEHNKIKTSLSYEEKELVETVYEQNKDELEPRSWSIRFFETLFLQYLDQEVKKNTQEVDQVKNLKLLFVETKEMIDRFLTDMSVVKKFDLSKETDLLKVLNFEKQIFYATNQFTRANKEYFGKLSAICNQTIRYQVNTQLIDEYIELHR